MARKKVAPEEEIVNAVGEETALGLSLIHI
mgnify:FL=1